jgi:phosphohistidine swiveling domain-containing protein
MKALSKIYTRDYPIILDQIWGRSYVSFLGTRLKVEPGLVFYLRRGLTEAYRDLQSVNHEIDSIIKKTATKNRRFYTKFIAEYSSKALILKNNALKQEITRLDLLRYCRDLRNFWPAIYVYTYLPKNKTVPLATRRQLLKFRQAHDRLEYVFFEHITGSLHHLYPKLGKYSKFISWEELRSNTIPSKFVLVRRSKEQIIYKDKLISLENFRLLQNKLSFYLADNTKIADNVSEIKGQAAFKGRVKGKVRKIFKSTEINTIKKGEILVTYMTVPNFLPAMKKAAAFVTDEGGITCHAAIVAREMKKPCLIGTKIATSILKNGDYIEVNASRGLIRILERAK